MTVFYERCPCGAEFRVEDESADIATGGLETWRDVHRHEISKGFGDMSSSESRTGFQVGRYGRIEDVE